jgi:GTPase SAR1 family protein
MEDYIKITEIEQGEFNLSEFMKKINKAKDSYYKKFVYEDIIKKIENIIVILYTFLNMSENDDKETNKKVWKSLIEEAENYKKFYLSKKLPFRFIFLGKYSSGKSSLINSIIGYNLNILDTKLNGCTKNAFIIKYCKDVNDISLYKGKIIKDFKDIYIIEEGGKIKEGKEDVKKEIHELNKGDDGESEDDLNYYIIKAPIESFDNNENVKEIKYQIELIDLPGIDISKNYDKIFREEMMQFPNGIIYLSIGTLEDKTNINLIETILKNRLFNSTFFVRTLAD